MARSTRCLFGHKYKLIPFRETDISSRYVSWLNDPKVNQYLEVRFAFQTVDTTRAYVQSFYGATEKYIWGIYLKCSNYHIGTATLYNINRDHGSGEIGLMIGEISHWGGAASSEALEAILEFAFVRLKLRRITGGSYAKNMGMNFTFKRLGFELEGKYKDAYLLPTGDYCDGYRWGILAHQWR